MLKSAADGVGLHACRAAAKEVRNVALRILGWMARQGGLVEVGGAEGVVGEAVRKVVEAAYGSRKCRLTRGEVSWGTGADRA